MSGVKCLCGITPGGVKWLHSCGHALDECRGRTIAVGERLTMCPIIQQGV